MSFFIYFAYGSNMLSARLQERCPGAESLGKAWANGYGLAFCKIGADGSGKATLVPDERYGARTVGVLYRIPISQRPLLDQAEARYDRNDAFLVQMLETGSSALVTTYFAQAQACSDDLIPYDWYVGLMLAGAAEHDFDADDVDQLASTRTMPDPDADRAIRMMWLADQRKT